MAELKAELERQGAAAATEHAKQQQQAAAALASAELQAATVRSKLDARAASLEAQLKEQSGLAAKYKAVAEPPKAKFFRSGRYTHEVDLTSLEVIANLGVSPNAVPQLFDIFGRFFGVKIPTRSKLVCVGTNAQGVRQYERKELMYIPGRTHMKELPAIGGELHKIQVGSWLLQDADAHYCYIADGANSQQREIFAQILSRRNKQTGRLESMALSIDELNDKSAEGEHSKFKAALASIAEAWEEADALGLLGTTEQDLPDGPPATAAEPTTGGPTAADSSTDGPAADQQPATDEPPADAAAFFALRRHILRARLHATIRDLKAAATMNDRASTARKAARRARGGDGSSGGGDVADDPTCAHHAVANIGEEGRKAIDKLLKAKMNITEEQSEADSAKVKALRTNVGWFSSPACSLIYQVAALPPASPLLAFTHTCTPVSGRLPLCMVPAASVRETASHSETA